MSKNNSDGLINFKKEFKELLEKYDASIMIDEQSTKPKSICVLVGIPVDEICGQCVDLFNYKENGEGEEGFISVRYKAKDIKGE